MINHLKNGRKIISFIFLFSFLLFGISVNFIKGASVTLQQAEVDNLDDGMAMAFSAGNEYGAASQMDVGAPLAGWERQAFIKWSLASLPQGSTITSASLQLYYAFDGLETDDRLQVATYYISSTYAISGQPWTEGTGPNSGNACTGNELCWNTRPTGTQINSAPESSILFNKSQGAFSGWYNWPITQMVQQAVNSGNGSITVALLSSWTAGSLASSDYISFRTKEYWSSPYRPKLVINYETGPVNDVAVSSIIAPATTTQGSLAPISVTVKNEGNQTASFTVQVSDLTDGILLGTNEVSNLTAGAALDLSYNWDTGSSSLGVHSIEARASVIAGETDTADNVKNTAATILSAEPVASQKIKGATYKPNYATGETVEFVAVVMDSKASIENNIRFVGTDDWNVSYRVINPDSTIYQDWQNIVTNNSWGIGSFNLSTGQTGTFTIQLKLADATITPLENITFSISENNQVPFYRNEIIRAADFVVSLQNPDGSFPAGTYTSPGSPSRILTWAYKITGNLAYYNAAVNYLEDQINCGGTDGRTSYSTCAYAEFQSSTNDTQFAGKLNSCAQLTYNLRDISPYYIEKGEASYCLYKAWEATGNPTIKTYADDMVSSIINANSWDEAKNTWYFSDQTYRDGIFTGTLTALGVPWYSDSSFISKAIQAQNLFVPQFYQDSSYGPGSTPSLYSLEILGDLASGHFPHFTAEPAISMSGLFKATLNRDWLLKTSLPAKWIAQGQEADGRFEDIQSPSDDIWSTMWAVWGLNELPSEVFVEVVDKDYNLTISNTAWNEKNKTLSANVAVPAGQLGKIRFIIPANENLNSVLIDGIPTSGYIPDGRKIVVNVAEGNHVVQVSWGTGADITPPERSNFQPAGVLPSGTTQTNISLATNELATCRYSTTAGTAYGSMTNTFTTTGDTAHSTQVTGLTDGNTYNYYVRCQDAAGNSNTTDYPISFSVASATALENFTTYSESDPYNVLNVAANTITVTGLQRQSNARVYKSFGAGYFGNNFEHLVSFQVNSMTGAYDAHFYPWAVANTSSANLNSDPIIGAYVQSNASSPTGSMYIFLFSDDGSVDTSDYYNAGPSGWGTRYYLTITRNGTTVTAKIYNDANRTNLLDTLSVTTGNSAYEYVYGTMSRGGGTSSNTTSGYVYDLDL